MITCFSCGRELGDAAHFCKVCGAKQGSSKCLTIGQAEDNDFVVANPQVSRYHAVLIRQADGGLLLRDLRSRNGTFVDGQSVTSVAVDTGMSIALGLSPFHWDVQKSAITSRYNWLIIGSQSENDIVIDDPTVSRYHLLVRQQGDRYLVLDLNSTNGTFVNGEPIRWNVITLSDRIQLGNHILSLEDLANRQQHQVQTGGTVVDTISVALQKETITVGRSTDNDVVVDHPQVSRHHAKFSRRGASYIVEDLGSSNGTFLNGRRIKREEVGPTDQTKIGGFILKIQEEAGKTSLKKSTFRGSTILQGDQIIRSVKLSGGSKVLIDNVSLTVLSNELVALMGPAGAGKTTLMMCLNGYSPPTDGYARLNGQDIYQHYESFRGNIGYVPQDDVIHKELTVYEALYYTAKLRLPSDTADNEINSRISKLLQDLDIEEARDVIIGDGTPERKGISGGQRKRVNLCQELLTSPDILFLDEPTSGLDHINTRKVMHILRNLADSGRAIVLTIHQPAEEFYTLTDNLILLDQGGKLGYYGGSLQATTYFESQGCEPAEDTNPAEYVFEALKTKDPDENQRVYLNSEMYQEYVAKRAQMTPPPEGEMGKKRLSRRPGLRQWWILTRRYARIKFRDSSNLAIMLIQAPLVGLLIALAFGMGDSPDPTKALFFMTISAIWFGCSNASREIVAERAIYLRERMVNLKIPSYVFSKLALLSVFSVFQCLVLVAIPYWLIGGSGELANFVKVAGILSLASFVGLALGLVLSSLVRSNEAAIALVPIVMIPQIVLGGAILPLRDMDEVTELAAGFMISRWAFEATMIVEDPETDESETVIIQPVFPPGMAGGPGTRDAIQFDPQERDTLVTVQWNEAIGVDEDNMSMDLACLGILGAMCCLTVFAMLRLKDIQ